jgi:hypothetical protein
VAVLVPIRLSAYPRISAKTYCLYEAPSAQAIRSAAERAGLPADVIVEVAHRVQADGSLVPL